MVHLFVFLYQLRIVEYSTVILILNTALLVHREPTKAKTRTTKRFQEKEGRTYRVQG